MKKLFITLSVFMFLFSCSSKEDVKKDKFITVYTSDIDTVFWISGNHFDSKAIRKGVWEDSVFMSAFLKELSVPNTQVIFKPMAGSGGGTGEAMMNMNLYFQKNNINNISFAKIDSVEKKYFNTVSILEAMKTFEPQAAPEAVTVQSPTSISSKVSPDSCLVFTLTKKRLYYMDHINGTKDEPQEIKLYSKDKIVRILNDIENRHQVKLSENEKLLLIKGDGDALYSSFKILKEALKEKNIFKFRLVTNED